MAFDKYLADYLYDFTLVLTGCNQTLVVNVFPQLSVTGLCELLNFCHRKLGRNKKKEGAI